MLIKTIHYINYLFLRAIGETFAILPRFCVLACGHILGFLFYYLHSPFRKKALTSLSVAFGKIKNEKWIKKIARQSFQNLAITCLEFISIKKVRSFCSFEGGEDVLTLLEKKQGVIFLTAHQANWEIPFLAVTTLYPGVGIGRPIKNKPLYRWILSVRENYGGKIINPKRALKEGIKALQEGKFIGIVGDQGYPEGNYSYPFFGTRAWTSTAPALLAYRTNCPLVVVFNRREKGNYIISRAPPIWPDLTKPMKEEVHRLMDTALGYMEKSIAQRPGQWLWQHDRWKQQKIDHVKRDFRYAFVLITLPLDPTEFLPLLPLFKEIYPRGFLSLLAPAHIDIPFSGEIFTYQTKKELFIRDYRFQMVYDFYDSRRLRRHFKTLSAINTVCINDLKKLCPGETELSKILIKAVCKENASRSLFY